MLETEKINAIICSRLGDLAEIHVGFTFRSQPELKENGIPLVQLKDLSDLKEINALGLDRVSMIEAKETHLLHSGDLVFRSRGAQPSARVISAQDEPIMFASPLMRIRPDRSLVHPTYLAWYINSSSGRAFFETVSAGSSVQMISKASLSDFPVKLPSMDAQIRIVELVELQTKERVLVGRQLALKEQLITTSIANYLNNF